MASLQAQADAVRSAVVSISTCTPTTSATLKELLLGSDDNIRESSKPIKSKPTKTTQPSSQIKRKPTVARGASARAATSISKARVKSENGEALGPKERATLATQVINATLKALGDAAKAPPAPKTTSESPTKLDMVKAATRKALRRSNSMPMTPLQPRSLNRTSTSPATTRTLRSPASLTVSTSCLATIECARAAFATLRDLQSSGSVTLPELQLELGMSSFISKLIALNLYDQAVKELRVLKRRLENMVLRKTGQKNNAASSDPSATPKTLSDLLDYPTVTEAGPLLGFIITSQLQALRILHGLKKSAHLEAVLPFLQQSNESSPLNLLVLNLKTAKPNGLKCAKDLESLSQCILSLTPSVSAKDDALAQEPRLSPRPGVSLQAQALGLITRLQSWKVSGHKGDVDKDILLPLSKCLSAFCRRSPPERRHEVLSSFLQIWDFIEQQGLRASTSSKSPLAAIYQILATSSRESGDLKEARKWVAKLRDLTDAKEDSAAKYCAVTAHLLALSLKETVEFDEDLVSQVLDGIQGPLSGSVTELDDLLVGISLLRKAATGIVTNLSSAISKSARQLFETFMFQLPRFASRWLGKPPSSNSATKDFVRFEQRRELLSKHLHTLLDSVLMLTKVLLDAGRLSWDVMDPVLQDVLALLENMGDYRLSNARINPSASYHVKISHFYYQQHMLLRKVITKSTEAASLRALRRSIDSVKQRSDAEQSKSQLLAKWEKFAELCKASGRRDDASNTLRSIRDHLVRQDVVSTITANLAKQPIITSWRVNFEAELLSRTVVNLAKLDRRPNDWTWLLSGEDRVTALEHDFYFILTTDSKFRQELDIHNHTIKSILDIFSPDDYPVRRLRTLLQLLVTNLDVREQVTTLRDEIEQTLASLSKVGLGKDVELVRFIPHLRALAHCVMGLISGNLDTPQIRASLNDWKMILKNCASVQQLADKVDDPAQLLNSLQSLADLARTKGLQHLSTDIVELSTSLSGLAVDSGAELRISQEIASGLHYLSLGHSLKAEKALLSDKALSLLPELPREATANYHLSVAEYHLAIGAFDKAEHSLMEAHKAATTSSDQPMKGIRLNKKISIAHASFLNSRLSLERGDSHHALQYARTAVKILFHDWTHLDELRASLCDESMQNTSQADSLADEMSLSSSRIAKFEKTRANTGPEFWTLAYPLFRFLSRLSTVYAHLGMYQETLYYADQAHKVALSMEAAVYIAQSMAWLALISLMAGKLERATELAVEARPLLFDSEPTCHGIEALRQLASVFGGTHDHKAESEMLDRAESMLEVMKKHGLPVNTSSQADIEIGLAKLSIEDKAPVKIAVRATSAPRATRSVKKPAPKKAVTQRAKAILEVKPPAEEDDTQIASLRASVLQSRSVTLLGKKDWAAAIAFLRTAFELSKLPTNTSQERFLMGLSLIGHSLEEMGADSVYSSIQDSTLSFPSVAGSKDRHTSDRLSLTRASPPRKGRNASQDRQKFIENLHEAQHHLIEAHTVACLNGDGNLVHRIATVLQNVAILLSNTKAPQQAAGHPAHATCSIELARNLTWRRERKALQSESGKEIKASWPVVMNASDARRQSLGLVMDMHHFQREFIDIIPRTWNVVSVSLSDNKHDLCITKLQAGHSPFAIRLPLERASSRDADNEVFDFNQGQAELHEIIQDANRTCHDARDLSQKEAKSAWWAEREALDERMKDLLENIEQTWLGGFKGILTQYHRRSDLLARFQKSFQNILDKHLPSRREIRGRRPKNAPPTKISLDPRILDLFVGLGDATVPQCDLDEPLTDLLYFVVDILQFHGERNAYDEIDFDAMVVDTFDALHAYHAAAKSHAREYEMHMHTILILDKPLHVFPWESLPCLQGAAVSRVPSLAYLKRAIVERKQSKVNARSESESEDELHATSSEPGSRDKEGHYIDINSGTYMLNPSADLVNTQSTFAKPLATLPPAWNAIETRAPSESEFEASLRDRDLLLYFGHGSGAQYIRGRTVRRLDKCRAVAMLMGCSSASLADAGQFLNHGPVWNYMLAGSPAVVGTLWDVTDRDIDRFAGRVFEEWGLLPKYTFVEDAKGKGKAVKRGKGKAKKGSVDEREAKGEVKSLVEAVTTARNEACRFRYLTAAAVCVYGIPVYIDK
ncbi:peptidase family C50-domain-containing protein [Xylariaceae sp. FL0016]|nr:peptidase family C50-domain-containing protein [Xylariaceae sp. FL0016]